MNNYENLVYITKQQVEYLQQMKEFISMDIERRSADKTVPRNIKFINGFIDTQLKILIEFNEILKDYQEEYEKEKEAQKEKQKAEMQRQKNENQKKRPIETNAISNNSDSLNLFDTGEQGDGKIEKN